MKPELLLPAGKIEAFYAAIEGGADAIYLGLSDFNARKRAKNFTIQQLPTLISIAHKNNVKLFITLNTVIKNNELPAMFSLLAQLEQIKVNAVIVQDLGVLYLLKKFFPKLEVHASTQMAFHNSTGVNFAKKQGISRVILARELTLNELSIIGKKSRTELELFVHGALCYSFSGMCLFSSYLGGMSANRGACKQPCRRLFTDNQEKQYLFSLKDSELINYIPKLTEIGIHSLKIEGRMKSAEYVYTIARAYRMAIDKPSKINQAIEILNHDIGREKTSYFMGGNISEAITNVPNTGIFTGKVLDVNRLDFTFTTEIAPELIKRIRVCSPDGTRQDTINLKENAISGNVISVKNNEIKVYPDDHVFIIGFATRKFPSKLTLIKPKTLIIPKPNEVLNKLNQLGNTNKIRQQKLYFRIDSLAWLEKIDFESTDYLILNLPLKEWDELLVNSDSLAANRVKLIAELPKYISETNIDKYSKLCRQLFNKGINKFMISHISQLEILPTEALRFTNENVYAFNDAAISFLQRCTINGLILPLENDLKNLFHSKSRNGIVPLHFTPQLFYSRMPVKVLNQEGEFRDDSKIDYRIVKRDGMTITIPKNPVSIFQNLPELVKKGYKQFLIDVSFTIPSQNTFNTLLENFYNSENIQPSSTFNYKKGLS